MTDDRISQGYAPDFDIDKRAGAQAELWVLDVVEALAKGNCEVEVKAPKPFLEKASPYVEYECRGRDGVWRKSGIATSKARLWVFTFGALPGGWLVETEWLKAAARLAHKKGQLKNESDGSNPTRGVYVTMADLWETRPFNPDGSGRVVPIRPELRVVDSPPVPAPPLPAHKSLRELVIAAGYGPALVGWKPPA